MKRTSGKNERSSERDKIEKKGNKRKRKERIYLYMKKKNGEEKNEGGSGRG